MHFLLSPLGDGALLITVGDSADEATHRRVRAVSARLDARPIAGMVECVPAFATVAVHYDPAAFGARPYETMSAAIREALEGVREEELPSPRTVEIPVCYGGEMGADLDEVANRAGLSPDEVVRLHVAGDYLVHMIGFLPGVAYLGGLDERVAVPRRSTPRAAVPAGSVGIGGGQTGVYPIVSPGGWHLIGRTPLRLFTPEAERPTLLRTGDRVRFEAISADQFRDLAEGA
ncbi:MAG: 5-oxoprolinase subunit PxpB [Gemmatimonadetes bacterium]|nr:5-oxoprolinase subunit PxpB [Gemmatimonadota bacterium]